MFFSYFIYGLRILKLLSVAFVGLMCFMLPAASASEQPSARITNISIDTGGPYLFLATGSRTTKPACATDNYWAIPNPTSDNSKAILALLINARTNGISVMIVGMGICDTGHTTRERVAYIISQ